MQIFIDVSGIKTVMRVYSVYGKTWMEPYFYTHDDGRADLMKGIYDTPTDLNQATALGGYYISNTNFSNLPVNRAGFLLVFGQSSSRFAQLYITDAGTVYVRAHFSSGFIGWRSI